MVEDRKNPEELLEQAARIKNPDEQKAFLDKACAGDEALLAEVESLLAAYIESGDFLDVPAFDPAVTLDSAPMPDASGTVIGRYKLLEKIGEGGMATVYMAEQKHPIRRRVALKIIKLGMDTKQVIGRFEAERQALAMMDHPNIAKVLDAGATDTGRPYFVMELVRGVSITRFCDTNHLTTQERLSLFVSVCQAVQHAHHKGIIHRDIKPSNILVTLHDGEPVVKVIDFGIAKAVNQQLTEKTVFTRYSQMIGTPEYMSPEQAELSGLDIDTRSDVFSLGVLLYELLTGTTPFDSEYLLSKGYAELQRIIREEEPLRPSTRISTMGQAVVDIARHRRTKPEMLFKVVRPDLDWIVMKTLEKDRRRRYQSPHDLAEDIRRHLNHKPVLAGRPSRVYRLMKLLRRHRSKAAGVIAAAVLLAAVVVISMMYVQSSNKAKMAESLEHREVLANAQTLRSRGQFQEAMVVVDAVLNSRHVGPEARLLRARLVLELEGPTEAIPELQELLNERDKIKCQAHLLLSWIYTQNALGDSAESQQYERLAKEHQDKGDELFSESKSAEACFIRAMLAGTMNETLKWLDEALEYDPLHHPSLKARTLVYYALRNYRNMGEDASMMIAVKRRDSLGHSLKAVSLREAGEFDEALEHHKDAIEESPKEAELYSERCQTHMRMGNYEQALVDANSCTELSPDEGMSHFLKFCALVALGRYEDAQDCFETIRESGVMQRKLFDRLAAKYVVDTLLAGLSWHPQDLGHPIGTAFRVMHDSAEAYRQMGEKATLLVPGGFHPSWSPDGTELAYTRAIGSVYGIEIINLKSGRTRLLAVPGFDPAWSPDGHYIAFNRDRGQKLPLTELTSQHRVRWPEFKKRELWVTRADGTEERFLTMGYWPCWSEDSNSIFYHALPDQILYSVSPVKGARPMPIFHLSYTEVCPTLSPDCRYVISGRGKQQIIELSSNSVVADCSMPRTAAGNKVNWSPDGSELCFGGNGLWIYDVETRTVSNVLSGFFGWCSWSDSDDPKLAIESASIYGWHTDIWIAELDPNVPTTVALGPGRTLEQYHREMIDWVTRMTTTDPEDWYDFIFSAVCHRYLQEYAGAAADLDKALLRLGQYPDPDLFGWTQGDLDDLAEWGIQKYDAGEYEQALDILTRIDAVRHAIDMSSTPAEIAHIAMSLHQLGRSEQAVSTLEQLYEMLESTRGKALLTLLCMVEKTLAGDNSSVRQVWECIELGKLDEARQRLGEIEPSTLHQSTDVRRSVARTAGFLVKAYHQRGTNAKYSDVGYQEAISDYRMALRLDPNYARVYSDLGWVLATCPENEYHNEAGALENVTKACELTEWNDHRYVGVLAAVYAENGDFNDAVKWQKEAIGLVTGDSNRGGWQVVHELRLRLYQSGKTYQGANPWRPSIEGMVAHWDFENFDGVLVRDISGNGLDGTLVGDAQIMDDHQREGQVLCLDGHEDWVDCGEDPLFDVTSKMTIACWVKVNRFDKKWQTIVSKGDRAWRLARDAERDQLQFACTGLSIPSDKYTAVRGNAGVNDGKWHHVAGVYDGSQACLYIDGVLDVSLEASGEIRINNWNVLIGANEEKLERSFDGRIDDMRIYDCALTEAEIKKLYEDTKASPNKN